MMVMNPTGHMMENCFVRINGTAGSNDSGNFSDGSE